MTTYQMDVIGAERVSTKFERMGLAAIHAQPAMETVAELVFAIIGTMFDSQGRRGGGSWKMDSPEWLQRKLREGLDPRIGHATLALRSAFTQRDAPHQNLEITRSSMTLTSDLPYQGTQQRNRPFVRFLPSDRLAIRKVVRDYLVGVWRTA